MWLKVTLTSNFCGLVIESGSLDMIPRSSRDSLGGLVQLFNLISTFLQLQIKGSNLSVPYKKVV